MKTASKPASVITPAPAPTDSGDWLAVSTNGFAQQNAGREPSHLVKELVQNSLDAIDGERGNITLRITHQNDGLLITCTDSGCGISDIENIRTVFWTSKQDSHLNRGRMGRGFKEMLCLAKHALVNSKNRQMEFLTIRGKRTIKRSKAQSHAHVGTSVMMLMPWGPEVVQELERYFETFLVPANIEFTVNDKQINHRFVKHNITATLTTEAFVEGVWKKPQYKTTLHLVPCLVNDEPFIYEMGIPVCSAEWDRPYHINVQQRVPMNPNRDAVASGYPAKLHKACLPTLIEEMKGDDLRREWVGEVAGQLEPDVQKQIISKGWGDNVVRSVPVMGQRRDHDADAREIDKEIVNTRHLSSGFREIMQAHVPTSAEAVSTFEKARVQQAAMGSFNVEDAFEKADDQAKEQRRLIERCGGRERVEKIVSFCHWFTNKLLEEYGDFCNGVKVAPLLSGETVKFGTPAVATWSSANVLTIGVDSPDIWKNPLSSHALGILIHEAAHNRALHHGDEFHKEVEKMGGRGAYVMFTHAAEIAKRWGDLTD